MRHDRNKYHHYKLKALDLKTIHLQFEKMRQKLRNYTLII